MLKVGDKVRIVRFENNILKEPLLRGQSADNIYIIQCEQVRGGIMKYGLQAFKGGPVSMYVYDESYFMPIRLTNEQRVARRRDKCTGN